MTWLAPHDGRPGRPAVFSDAAIQFCLSIKILFKLPLRQAEALELRAIPGVFVCGEMLDWEAPTGGYLLTGCLATGRWAGKAAG